MSASKIITDAVREWLENHEDAGLLPVIETARTEWQEKDGCSWNEVEHEIEATIDQREQVTGTKSVQN